MLLSLNSPALPDALLAALRSLACRGRHFEADRLAHAHRKRVTKEVRRAFFTLRAEIAIGLGRFAHALAWTHEARTAPTASADLSRVIDGAHIRALLGLGRFREAAILIENRPVSTAADPETFLF